MSKQYDSFMDDLEQLMLKHNVVIYTSMYDSIEVWIPLVPNNMQQSLENFVDKTQENKQ